MVTSLPSQTRSMVMLEDMKNEQIASSKLGSLVQKCMPKRRAIVRVGSRRQVQYREYSPAVIWLVSSIIVHLAAMVRHGYTLGEEFTETLTLHRSHDRLSPLCPRERIKALILRIIVPFFLARPKNAQSFFDFLFSGAYSRVRSTKVGQLTGVVTSLTPLIYKLQLAGFYAGFRNRYLTDEVNGISRVSLAATTKDEGGLLYPALSFMVLSTLLLDSYEKWRRKSEKITEKTRRSSWSSGAEQGSLIDATEINLGYQRLTCLICYSEMKSPAALVCGHLFCWRCILEWLEENSSASALGGPRGCPLCRTACKPQQVVPVFHFASSERNDMIRGASWLSWLPWRDKS